MNMCDRSENRGKQAESDEIHLDQLILLQCDAFVDWHAFLQSGWRGWGRLHRGHDHHHLRYAQFAKKAQRQRCRHSRYPFVLRDLDDGAMCSSMCASNGCSGVDILL